MHVRTMSAGKIVWRPTLTRTIANGRYNDLRQDRVGIMIHFDASGNDQGAVDWFADPRCLVSYHKLVLDNGDYVQIAPDNKRAWHAGVCRPSGTLTYSDANSAFYGISIASNERVECTALQMLTVAKLCREYYRHEGWAATDVRRIVGHDTEAWPRGRKSDPTGPLKLNPILSVENIRQLVPLIEPD